ncbi:MAG: Rdx family protein [Acidobacteria bacterium]|nr:Rdx family protein [Acidobacteriota bacterium]MCI0628446.1 Rdx family protein [Acidobacteriota bacterium]MCI0719752.1 Rdx family protein [Acidobacteriota bacterium]
MTEKLLVAGKQRIKSLELVPFNDGRFEVFRDGAKVYSKLETHAFPDEERLIRKIL